jgi:hypothetical protein
MNDFPITRRTLVQIEEWFIPILEPFLPLKKVRGSDEFGDFYWDFEEHSGKIVVLSKALRIIGGLRASMILADRGYVNECGALLRTVDDFTHEIRFLLEGCRATKPSKDYEEFVRQYFLPAARTADEYAKAPGESWVPRKAIFEAFVRSFGSVEKNSDKIRKSGKFIYHTYDKYVHGSYLTAVDLYSGDTKQFMLHGHNGGEQREVMQKMVTSRLFNALAVFAHVAEVFLNSAAFENFRVGALTLSDSGEMP